MDRVTTEYMGKSVFLMHERRQYSRHHGPFRGTWHSGAEHRQATILDLNLGGCFVDSMGGPVPGAVVQVSVTIQHDTVTLVGEVIYSGPVRGFAVAFTNNPSERMEELVQLLHAATGLLRA